MGVTRAFFRSFGINPVDIERLIKYVKDGAIVYDDKRNKYESNVRMSRLCFSGNARSSLIIAYSLTNLKLKVYTDSGRVHLGTS